MKVYVATDIDEIYGIFSTLEKAKKHVLKMVNEDVDRDIDKTLINYVVSSVVLDKSTLEYSEDMMKYEFGVDYGEVFDKGDD